MAYTGSRQRLETTPTPLPVDFGAADWGEGHLGRGVFLTRNNNGGENDVPGVSYSEPGAQVHLFQAMDGDTFSVYPLANPLEFHQTGDILIGVVSRFVVSGVTSVTRPAAMDNTASQGRSWLAVWTDDPPDPPVLPADNVYQTIDGFVAGHVLPPDA